MAATFTLRLGVVDSDARAPKTDSTMKTPRLHLALAGLLTLAGATAASAQFDDVYYDPSDVQETASRTYSSYDDADEAYADNGNYDSEFVGDNRVGTAATSYEDVPRYGESDFDNQPITVDDYSGYEYSSRIRRFNRPYQGFGYYDPVYVDQLYYDGFGRPIGQTALIYNNPYAFNSAVRFNRFNRFNTFGNPYGFNRFGRRSAFYDPFSPFNDPFYGGASAFGWGAPNAFGYGAGWGGGFNRFGGAGFGAGGFGGAYYCPPTWGNTGVAYNTPNAVTTRRSTVSDRGTRTVGSRSTVRPTSNSRATVPTSRSSTGKDRARTTTAPTSRSTRSSTPASRNNGRVAPSRSNSRSTSPSRSNSRSSRPTAPRERTAPSSRSSRPSYSAPRSSTRSSRPSYSAPRSSSPSRSSSPRSYSSPRSSSSSPRSSSPRSSSSSRSSSRSPR